MFTDEDLKKLFVELIVPRINENKHIPVENLVNDAFTAAIKIQKFWNDIYELT